MPRGWPQFGGSGGVAAASPGTAYQTPLGSSMLSSFGISATKIELVGFWLSYAIQVANGITVVVGVADAVNNYAFGIYNAAGSLVLHTAGAPLASTGVQTIASVESLPRSLSPGRYFFGVSGAAATAKLYYTSLVAGSSPFIYAVDLTTNTATTPGTMNSTVTVPARGVQQGEQPLFLLD